MRHWEKKTGQKDHKLTALDGLVEGAWEGAREGEAVGLDVVGYERLHHVSRLVKVVSYNEHGSYTITSAGPGIGPFDGDRLGLDVGPEVGKRLGLVVGLEEGN